MAQVVITASLKLTCSILLEIWLVLFSLGTRTTGTTVRPGQGSVCMQQDSDLPIQADDLAGILRDTEP